MGKGESTANTPNQAARLTAVVVGAHSLKGLNDLHLEGTEFRKALRF